MICIVAEVYNEQILLCSCYSCINQFRSILFCANTIFVMIIRFRFKYKNDIWRFPAFETVDCCHLQMVGGSCKMQFLIMLNGIFVVLELIVDSRILLVV